MEPARFSFVDQASRAEFEFALSTFPWYQKYSTQLTIILASLPGFLLVAALRTPLVAVALAAFVSLLLIRSLYFKSANLDLSQLDESQMLPTRVEFFDDYLATDDGRESSYRDWNQMQECFVRHGRLVIRLSAMLIKTFRLSALPEGQSEPAIDFVEQRLKASTARTLPHIPLTGEQQLDFQLSAMDMVRCRIATRQLGPQSRPGPLWDALLYIVPLTAIGLVWLMLPRPWVRIALFNELLGVLGFLLLMTLGSQLIARFMNRLIFGTELETRHPTRLRWGEEGLVLESTGTHIFCRWQAISEIEGLPNGCVAVFNRLPSLLVAIPATAFADELSRVELVQQLQARFTGRASPGSLPNVDPFNETGNPYQPPG